MNYLNYHLPNLHCFELSPEDTKRKILVATNSHDLWRLPHALAIHTAKKDIKITVLSGRLKVYIYEKHEHGELNYTYSYTSPFKDSENSGFKEVGVSKIRLCGREDLRSGSSFVIKANTLRTFMVERMDTCIWIVESIPTKQKLSIDNTLNYSTLDLTAWSYQNHYEKTSDEVKHHFLRNIKYDKYISREDTEQAGGNNDTLNF